MNIQSIIVTNAIGCTMLVILLISSYMVRQRRTPSDRLFTIMIMLTASSCIVETVTFILDGSDLPATRYTLFFGSTWLYLSNITISYLWAVYTDLRLYQSTDRIRRYYGYIAIPAMVGIVLLILNIPMQFIFSVDVNNFYHREAIAYSYYILPMYYLGYSAVLRRHRFHKYGRNEYFPIWMFLTPILIGASAQILVYGISTGWCSVALGLVGLYMCLQNELSYVDPLTKLYNRNYLDQILIDMRRRQIPVGGLMIDLDYFKSINDQYGHSTGDEALVQAAMILRRISTKKTILVRFAGDEFIVLQKTDKEEELAALEQSIREELERFNAEGSRQYTLSFSIGRSMYRYEDAAEDVFLNEMDDRMYSEKHQKHAAAAEPA